MKLQRFVKKDSSYWFIKALLPITPFLAAKIAEDFDYEPIPMDKVVQLTTWICSTCDILYIHSSLLDFEDPKRVELDVISEMGVLTSKNMYITTLLSFSWWTSLFSINLDPSLDQGLTLGGIPYFNLCFFAKIGAHYIDKMLGLDSYELVYSFKYFFWFPIDISKPCTMKWDGPTDENGECNLILEYYDHSGDLITL